MFIHQNFKIFLANKDCSISINSKRIYHLAFALGDVFATKPGDEFHSNRLVLAGDEEIMDTDKKRFVEIHQKSLKKM